MTTTLDWRTKMPDQPMDRHPKDAPHTLPPFDLRECEASSCDWDYCAGDSVAERWDEESKMWLPVCEEHAGDSLPELRIALSVSDEWTTNETLDRR